MQPHHLPTPLLTFASLLLIFSHTTALTLPLPSNLTTSPSLSTITNLTGHSIRNCVADPTWNPPSLLISPDCESALLQLEDEGADFTSQPGKFTYSDTHSTAVFSLSHSTDGAKRKNIRIPKRYVSGQCVVAIVMMKMFEDQGIKVPGVPLGKWPASEVVEWGELVRGGGYVRATCANGCGYATVGREDGVAVVLWKVGSWWDQFVWGMAREPWRGGGGLGVGLGSVE